MLSFSVFQSQRCAASTNPHANIFHFERWTITKSPTIQGQQDNHMRRRTQRGMYTALLDIVTWQLSFNEGTLWVRLSCDVSRGPRHRMDSYEKVIWNIWRPISCITWFYETSKVPENERMTVSLCLPLNCWPPVRTVGLTSSDEQASLLDMVSVAFCMICLCECQKRIS